MLCNNEQFASAIVILNVFIVNMIWSKVSGRRGSESTCAFKQCWLNGNTSEYLMMYSSSNSIIVFVFQRCTCRVVYSSLSRLSLDAHTKNHLPSFLSPRASRFYISVTWNVLCLWFFTFRRSSWNKFRLLTKCKGKIGTKSTSNNHFYALKLNNSASDTVLTWGQERQQQERTRHVQKAGTALWFTFHGVRYSGRHSHWMRPASITA